MAKRSLRAAVAACGILLAGVVVALSIFSHNPADAPGNTIHPPSRVPSNLLGPGGAWLAHILLETLGVAVYVLVAGWLILVILLLLRRGVWSWSLRAAGWLLLIPCTAVIADYLVADYPAGSVAGGGGTIGAWLHGW